MSTTGIAPVTIPKNSMPNQHSPKLSKATQDTIARHLPLYWEHRGDLELRVVTARNENGTERSRRCQMAFNLSEVIAYSEAVFDAGGAVSVDFIRELFSAGVNVWDLGWQSELSNRRDALMARWREHPRQAPQW